MPLTRSGTSVREYKIPSFYEASNETQVKQIPRPVDKSHAIIGTADDGRIYKIDATSSAADDGYEVLQANDTTWSGRWLLTAFGGAASGAGSGIYNVKSFGAVGDGITDDSTAIQAAVDEATAAGNGGIVFFPRGTYSIETTIDLAEGIRMQGVVALDTSTADHGSVIDNETGGGAFKALLGGGSLDRTAVSIEHLRFTEGTATGGTYAVQLASVVNGYVQDCSFSGHNNGAILLDNCIGLDIDRISITSADNAGILTSNANSSIRIRNSYFAVAGSGDGAVQFGSGAVEDITIEDNQFTANNGKGVYFTSGAGITAKAIRILNNLFENNDGASSADEDLYFKRTTSTVYTGCLISGNRFTSSGTGYAMRFEGLQSSSIRDNTASNATPVSLSLDANSQDNLIEANTFAGSYSDSGTNNERVDSTNEFVGLQTKDFVNDRTNARQAANGEYFDGASSLLSCGDSASLSFGDSTNDSPFSLTAIIRPDSLSSDFEIVAKANANFSFEYRFWVDNSDNKLRFVTYDNAVGVYIGVVGSTALVEGQTYHVAATYDGDATGYTDFKIYVNGVAETVADNSAGVYTAMHDTTTPLQIGYSKPSANSYSEGVIHSGLVYARELTAAQVLALSENGNTPETDDQWADNTTQTSGTLTVGQKYRIDTYVSADDFTNVGAGSNATGVEFVATGTTPTTYSNGSTLRTIGCVVALLPENIRSSNGDWKDASSNDLDATATSVSVLRKPAPQMAHAPSDSASDIIEEITAGDGATVLHRRHGNGVVKNGVIAFQRTAGHGYDEIIQTGAIADNATWVLNDNILGSQVRGFITVTNSQGAGLQCAIVALQGTNGAPVLVSDPFSTWSITATTASKINIYTDAGNSNKTTIENKTGGTINLTIRVQSYYLA